MPIFRWSSFLLYSAAMIAGAAAAVYAVFWLEGWVSALLGAMAALCAFLPFFAAREYRDECNAISVVNDRMAAHSEATDGFLQIQWDRMQTWAASQQQLAEQQIEGLRSTLAHRIEIDAAIQEAQRWRIEGLTTKLASYSRPHDPVTGKFVKGAGRKRSASRKQITQDEAARPAVFPTEPPVSSKDD
jgi:hypothetical protein